MNLLSIFIPEFESDVIFYTPESESEKRLCQKRFNRLLFQFADFSSCVAKITPDWGNHLKYFSQVRLYV